MSNKNRVWRLRAARLLGKQSSSDSSVHVTALAIPCIIELLARPGPAYQRTVVCLCPREHETHPRMKKASVTLSAEEESTIFDIHSTVPQPQSLYTTEGSFSVGGGSGAVCGDCSNRRKPFAVQHPVQLQSLVKIHPHVPCAMSLCVQFDRKGTVVCHD